MKDLIRDLDNKRLDNFKQQMTAKANGDKPLLRHLKARYAELCEEIRLKAAFEKFLLGGARLEKTVYNDRKPNN